MNERHVERVGTVVIGGGQAGLSVGYHLAQRGLHFVILDANQGVGDSWRERWDSLRLFTPARYSGLDGMPFPAPPHSFPTKDEMADYLQAYSDKFGLPVRNGVRVDRLTRRGGRFLIAAGEREFDADNVVVAMSNWQRPKVPALAAELAPDILQVHSGDYRNPQELQEGAVLIVGAGNSGTEIALDVVNGHTTMVSGPDTGHVPFRVEGLLGRLLVPVVLRLLFHRVLTTGTPMGRKARPKMLARGEPLVRTKPKDLAAAGVERVPRVVGVQNGLPLLEDGRVVEVTNVIWCTGFQPSLSWIDLPVVDDSGPIHERGVVDDEPGLYFVGLKFLHAVSSSQVHGVGRDASRIVEAIAARNGSTEASPSATPGSPVATAR